MQKTIRVVSGTKDTAGAGVGVITDTIPPQRGLAFAEKPQHNIELF
jgi:hypothetical protein